MTQNLAAKIFYFIYRFFGFPLMKLIFKILSVFNSKVRLGLSMREKDADGRAPWLQGATGTKPIWIHCASGEFEYARPVIARLKRQDPATPVLVTYFSPSIRNAVLKDPNVDLAVPSPWDTPQDLEEFINHHEPRALLYARTDVWPQMSRIASRYKIPQLLFSATLSETSSRVRGLAAWVTRITLSNVNEIYCVSEGDREAFRRIGLEAEVAGDTRFDQALARLESSAQSSLVADKTHRTRADVIVVGSSWPEDERVIVEAASRLEREKLFWIIAPHEPTESHLADLESTIKAAGMTSLRYSAGAATNQDFLIIDKIGLLAEAYLNSAYAFIGGSFKKNVHSVMEPLAAGCRCFVGPYHRNNREALEFISLTRDGSSPVEVVLSAQDLVESLQRAVALASADQGHEFANWIKNEVRQRSGRSDLVVRWVMSATQRF